MHTCVIVTADLRTVGAPDGRVLDSNERRRCQELHRDSDRLRSSAGATLLRVVSGALLKVDPIELAVDRTCPRCGLLHGKPQLPGHRLNVSVSHSGALVQVAATMAGQVGIDIQCADVKLTDSTHRMLEEALHIGSPADTLSAWSRLEAFHKATGEGLLAGLDALSIRTRTYALQTVSFKGRSVTCFIEDQAQYNGYVGAVVVLTNRPLSILTTDLRGWDMPLSFDAT